MEPDRDLLDEPDRDPLVEPERDFADEPEVERFALAFERVELFRALDAEPVRDLLLAEPELERFDPELDPERLEEPVRDLLLAEPERERFDAELDPERFDPEPDPDCDRVERELPDELLAPPLLAPPLSPPPPSCWPSSSPPSSFFPTPTAAAVASPTAAPAATFFGVDMPSPSSPPLVSLSDICLSPFSRAGSARLVEPLDEFRDDLFLDHVRTVLGKELSGRSGRVGGKGHERIASRVPASGGDRAHKRL